MAITAKLSRKFYEAPEAVRELALGSGPCPGGGVTASEGLRFYAAAEKFLAEHLRGRLGA